MELLIIGRCWVSSYYLMCFSNASLIFIDMTFSVLHLRCILSSVGLTLNIFVILLGILNIRLAQMVVIWGLIITKLLRAFTYSCVDQHAVDTKQLFLHFFWIFQQDCVSWGEKNPPKEWKHRHYIKVIHPHNTRLYMAYSTRYRKRQLSSFEDSNGICLHCLQTEKLSLGNSFLPHSRILGQGHGPIKSYIWPNWAVKVLYTEYSEMCSLHLTHLWEAVGSHSTAPGDQLVPRSRVLTGDGPICMFWRWGNQGEHANST